MDSKLINLEEVALTALENGFTLMDTNFVMGGEKAIGRSLKKYFQKGHKREDVFVLARLPPFGNRVTDAGEYVKLSLENFDLDYLDMYMFTEPWGAMRDPSKKTSADAYMFHENGSMVLDFQTDHILIWKALEAEVKAGRVRSIGLINFNEKQILNVINNCEIQPSYLLVGEYVYNQERGLRELCAKHNITMGSYAPLGCVPRMEQYCMESSRSLPDSLKDPVVLRIAETHGKTAEQVLLRHQQQEGVIPNVPGLSQPERIKAAIDIFDFSLTDDELRQLDSLDRGENGRFIDDYRFPGIHEHAEYPFSTHS